MLAQIQAFVRTHPARVYAVIAAIGACFPAVVAGVPTVALVGLVAALLGVGEAVQRTENTKTQEAAHEPAPEDEGPFTGPQD